MDADGGTVMHQHAPLDSAVVVNIAHIPKELTDDYRGVRRLIKCQRRQTLRQALFQHCVLLLKSFDCALAQQHIGWHPMRRGDLLLVNHHGLSFLNEGKTPKGLWFRVLS
jgi:hypothetical protein